MFSKSMPTFKKFTDEFQEEKSPNKTIDYQ